MLFLIFRWQILSPCIDTRRFLNLCVSIHASNKISLYRNTEISQSRCFYTQRFLLNLFVFLQYFLVSYIILLYENQKSWCIETRRFLNLCISIHNDFVRFVYRNTKIEKSLFFNSRWLNCVNKISKITIFKTYRS